MSLAVRCLTTCAINSGTLAASVPDRLAPRKAHPRWHDGWTPCFLAAQQGLLTEDPPTLRPSYAGLITASGWPYFLHGGKRTHLVCQRPYTRLRKPWLARESTLADPGKGLKMDLPQDLKTGPQWASSTIAIDARCNSLVLGGD